MRIRGLSSSSFRRRVGLLASTALAATTLSLVGSSIHAAAASGSPCGTTINPVMCENSQTSGVTPQSVWDISGSGDASIQGFATDISVNAGTTESFKIDTNAAYTIDIYRLGYYGGNGARKIASVSPSATLPQTQPQCAVDPSVTLVDCGIWAVSASWAVPSTAVSGVYIARLTRTDTGGASHIPFIVRNDASTSDIVYQTSDPTWEAYNRYGDADFYTGVSNQLFDSPSRARKISYNRPFSTRNDSSGRDFLFSNEYPTLRFLEQNGYDVTYISGVDTDRYGATLLKQHKVFMSVGHDEYWSQAQRANVESARDAGVNMMFLSGNEVYWHTRYESSIDGSNTAYRTLVCYKETWDKAASDPSGEATATWRDPTFADAPGGSNPENGLTGTMYMANSVDLPITVTQAQGKMRLWRNTGLASMSGSSTALAPHTIGYESDEDVDNGFRPAGLIDLSTRTGSTPEYLQDFGQATAAGTTTHHVTLYKASSGAFVFGAGTIQWGWGLSSVHDGTAGSADARMQQATVNLLADMGAQPQTLMSGMAAASPSTDTQAPTSTITSPTAGASIANGTRITVTGTASDTGGGVVAGVEVSIDSGATWHPASGTTSWSYTAILYGNAAVRSESRATDDSANTETPSGGVSVTSSCPCTLFGETTPTTPDSGDAYRAELGTRFTTDTSGYVTGVRFYKASTNTGPHIGTLWTATGTQLATGTFSAETASGWQTLVFVTAVPVSANTTYVVSYWAPNGHYAEASRYFYYRTYDAAPLHAEATSPDGSRRNGVYASAHGFPSQAYLGSNYYVDPVFQDAANGIPSVLGTSPTSGATAVPTSVAPTVTFSTSMAPSSLNFTLAGPSGNVGGTLSYDDSSKTATFNPSTALTSGTAYTATVSGISTSGTAMSSPYTWSFTTAGAVTCPCTLFPASATPTTVDSGDRSGISLGMQFSSSVSGYITGARFYKSTANIGTHTASLWSAAGTRLATATFTTETASGWQTVSFASSVAIAAGTTYVVSYYAPSGHYSEDDHYFDSAVTRGPLTASPGAGQYVYGGDSFPNATYANANYWVDAIFNTSAAPAAPTVTSTTPGSGATDVSTAATPTAVFSSSVTSSSVTFSLTGPSGAVAGATSYDDTSKTATFTPSAALSSGTTYTASVSATGINGVAMSAPYTWSFTTVAPVNCPCTLFAANATPTTVDSGDRSAVTLGLRFSSSVAGYVTGLRFYKSAANTGAHTGTLWSSTGTQLATGAFANESSSGWQTLQFTTPVSITAGVTYVISYYAPAGHYSEDYHYFDSAVTRSPLVAPAGAGVYANGNAFPSSTYLNANYWVDPLFSTAADQVAPTVSATTPGSGEAGVDVSTKPTVTFSAPVSSQSISFALTSPSGSVPGTVTYDGASQTATFTPSVTLKTATTYTATASATGTNGVAMANAYTWSFTTASSFSCPCTLFSTGSAPITADSGDSGAVTVGVKFSASVAGAVTGLRFYKALSNGGTHTGTLWSGGGTQLATGTFSAETGSGWQTLQFDSPVAVTANTTYVVSYHAPNGHYAEDPGTFAAPLTNGPLTAPTAAGVYTYGADAFPTSTYGKSNYWVDPIFSPVAVAPAVTETTPNSGATNIALSVTPAATFSSSITPSSLQMTLTSSSGAVTGSATYDDPSLTATFTPAGGLSPGTAYTASVSASGANGVAMAQPFTWTFTTGTAPTVTAKAPTGSGVSTAVKPTATFSAAVTDTSVVFGLSSSSGAIAGSVAYDSQSKTATFTPSTALSASSTYTASVAATGTNGVQMSAPTTWSFTTAAPPDTTPPVVTALAASGSGTSAVVNWTTDEAATSQVNYGTTTTSLGSTATSAGMVTSHSVTLSGLALNTRYYYRVTSADAAGNSTTSPPASGSPASYAPSTTPLSDTTSANFTAGTLSSTYVSNNGDGEVVLAPTSATEFSGTTLPSGWTSTATVTGGKSTVASGVVTISGAKLTASTGYSNGRVLDVLATLGQNQSIGWMSTSNSAVTMGFTVNSSNQLLASVNDGGTNVATAVAVTPWTSTPHRLRIEWTSTAVTFYVDDAQKYTHAFTSLYLSTYRPQFADSVTTDSGLIVDWARVGVYAASGTFTSRVFDATAAVGWDGISWDASVPTGTTLTVKVRTGSTATPNSSWSAWTTIATSGTSVGRASQYLQYQLTLTSSGTRFATPTMRSLTAAFHV